MSRRFRFVAPSGTDIGLSELTGWLFDIVIGRDRTESFADEIKRKYTVKHCFFMASARAALALIFSMLKKNEPDPAKIEIVLPAYTCYSLPAAAEIAGLSVRLCDIDQDTLSYKREQLEDIDFSRVLAIVSANLYGNPDELEYLKRFAHSRNVIFIDDAAQSMNAMISDRYAGTFGDIGIYSLDKGKNITSIQGGIIVTNDDHLAALIDQEVSSLPWPGKKQQLSEAIKLIAYTFLLRPWLYWAPARIPALGLGKTIYTTDYLFTRFSPHLASIAFRLFKRIGEISNTRCSNSRKLYQSLTGIQGIKFFNTADNVTPACLRLPLLIMDAKKRDKLVSILRSKGIGASTSYPKSLEQLEEIRSFLVNNAEEIQSAKYISQHILTLPTMPYLSSSDIESILVTITLMEKDSDEI